jgi:predicted MarR family transcription regulator
MVCNPSRTPESKPRAISLGLIRLMHALQAREWSKAVAYCAQVLHREDLPEVRVVLKRLQSAGHDGLRFDG